MSKHENRAVAIIQARMGSTRLPGKALLPLCGKPLLWHIVQRLRRCTQIDEVMIATTEEHEDDAIELFAHAEGVAVYRGSADNVLKRYVEAMKISGATIVARITGDNPLIDPGTVDRAVRRMTASDTPLDCVNVGAGGGFPRGLDCEVISCDALLRAHSIATSLEEREHVSLLILRQRERFRVIDLTAPAGLRGSGLRLTVDEQDDFRLIQLIYQRLYHHDGIVDVRNVVHLLNHDPQLVMVNAHVRQKPTL